MGIPNCPRPQARSLIFDFHHILLTVLVVIIIVLAFWLFFGQEWAIIAGTIAVGIGFWRLWVKHNRVLKDPNNLSLYGQESDFVFWSIPRLPKEIKRHYVFKKCDFQHNRVYWRSKQTNKLYYTNQCRHEPTLAEIFRRCDLRYASESIHKFVELFVTSLLLRDDMFLVDQLIDYRQVEFECREFDQDPEDVPLYQTGCSRVRLCGPSYLSDPESSLSTFFEYDVEEHVEDLRPDICLVITHVSPTTGEETNIPIIIDVFNGPKAEHKYSKYSALKASLPGLLVVIFSSVPQRRQHGSVESYNPSLYGDVKEFEQFIQFSAEDYQSFSLHCTRFMHEIIYWNLCWSEKEIISRHKRNTF